MATTPAMGGRHVPRGGPRLRASLAVDALPSVVVALPVLAAALIGGTAVACGTVLAVRRLSGGFGVAESAVAWLVTAAGIVLVSVADQSSRHGGGVFGPVAARCGLALGVISVALPPRAGDWASILAVMTAAAVAVVRMMALGSGVCTIKINVWSIVSKRIFLPCTGKYKIKLYFREGV